MNRQLSLLEFLAYRSGCSLLSELRKPDWLIRSTLLHTLEGISPEDATPAEWNDALQYLTGAQPEETARAAREKLLTLLTQSEAPMKSLANLKKCAKKPSAQ